MKNLINNSYPLVCIVAKSKDNIIGDGEKLLWNIPNDLIRLKKITMGHPLIMGRKTFSSIGKPLPGRGNIVLTRNINWSNQGIIVSYEFNESIEKANTWINSNFNLNSRYDKKIFIFGGGEIYKLALDYCNIIEMTIVDINIKQGIKFPILNDNDWKKILLEKSTAKGTLPSYSYWKYIRKSN